MSRLKALAAATALTVATLGFVAPASAANFLCNPAPGVCTFDGTTGGFTAVKRAAKQTGTDMFSIFFDKAGIATLSFTTNKLIFGSATFDGMTFTPVAGQSYSFDIAAAGTYKLLLTTTNPTKLVSSYSGTIDFAAVPEPAAWGMMIGGFGIAGAAMRRRKPVPAIA